MKRTLRVSVLILGPLFLAVLVLAYFEVWAPPKAAGLTTQEIPGYEGLSLTVPENSVSPTGITVEILNDSGKNIDLESDLFYLNIEKKDQWHALQFTKDMVFTAMSRPVTCPNGEIIKESYNWEFYGKLRPGHYRIVLTFYDRTEGGNFETAAEFTVK